MDVNEIFNRLISQLDLVKNERLAVVYASSNIGDFYSLCSSFEYAEKLWEKSILYYSSPKNTGKLSVGLSMTDIR